MHECLQLSEVVVHIATMGDVLAWAPMRGVCRHWRHLIVSTPMLKITPQKLIMLLRPHSCKRTCWPIGTRADLCKVMALPVPVFMRLNVKRHLQTPYFSTIEVLRRTLKHTGGLWSLLERHQRRKRGERLKPVAFALPTRQKVAVSEVDVVLKTHKFDVRLRKRILALMHYVGSVATEQDEYLPD